MNQQEAIERRDLVRRLRHEFRPHYFMRCLEIAYRVIPCCNTCEYYSGKRCSAPPGWTFDHCPQSGEQFREGDRLCIHWSPSPSAILSALIFAYPPPGKSGGTEAETAKSKRKTSENTSSPRKNTENENIQTDKKRGPPFRTDHQNICEQARRYKSGEITATDAAKQLNISLGYFYKKVRSLNEE